MDESDQLVFRAALSEPQLALAAWHEWRDGRDLTDATNLLTWAGGYIHRNLSRAGISDPYLAGIARHNWLTNSVQLARHTLTMEQISRRWKIIALKSFGMIGSFSAHKLRPLADLDFYCSPDDAREIAQFLTAEGFTPLLDVSVDEFTERIMYQRGSWNFESDQQDIDVHWKILDHLDFDTNARLADEWSRPFSSPYGEIRKLSDEATVNVLALHYSLQDHGKFNRVFDVVELASNSDAHDIVKFGTQYGTVDALRDVFDRVVEWGVELPASVAQLRTQLDSVHTHQTPHGAERLVLDSVNYSLVRWKPVYQWWLSWGRSPRLERRLLTLLGPFSTNSVVLPENATTVIDVVDEPPTGPGWHHLFPGDGHRWADNPDSRIVLRGIQQKRTLLTVDLVEPAWSVHTPGSLGIFANGIFVGVLTRHESSITAEIGHAAIRGFVEISFRLVDRDADPQSGMWAGRNILLAPIASLTVHRDEGSH